MSVERQRKENGRSESPQDAKESSGSSTGTGAAYTNGHQGGREVVNISICGESDGDSSIALDDSLCVTPIQPKFKVPSQRPRTTAKTEKKKRVSSASFSHEHSRVLDLEREMRKLLAERNQLSKQLYTSKQDNTKLEGKVQVAVRDKSALMSQMASLSKHNRDLSRGKNILLAKAFASVDVRKTRSLEQSLKQANRDKRAKQKELEKLNIQMNMTSKEMQEKLLASLDEMEEMEIKIEDLESDVQHLTECHAASEESNNLLKESLASQEEACKSLQEQLAQFELTIQEKERELCEVRETLTAEGEQLKSTLHSTQERVVEVEQEVSGVQDELTQSSQKITDLETLLQSAECGMETEIGRREGVERELTQCRGQLSEVEDKVHTLESRVTESSQLNSELQTQLKFAECEMEVERGRREGVEKELAQCRDQLSEVGDKVHLLELRVTESSQLNSELQTQLNSVREELEREKQLKHQVEAKLASTTTELNDQKTLTQRVQRGHAGDLEAAHAKCSDLLTELEKAVSEGRETKTLLESQIAAVEADREKAVQVAEEVKERENEVVSQLTQLKKENVELQTSRSTAQEQLVQVKEELATLQEQVDGPLARETVVVVHEEITRELVEVQTRLVEQEKQSTRIKNEMGKRVSELEEELERMKSEREQLELAYLDLQEKCRPFQDQIEGLSDVNALLQSQAALARKEAQDVSDQFASLVGHQNTRQKIKYVKKIRDENAALKMEITQLRMELSKQKKQMRRIQNENKAGPPPTNPPNPPPKPLASKN